MEIYNGNFTPDFDGRNLSKFKFADASKLAPLGYFEIVTNIILGYYIFNNFPDYWTFLGLFILKKRNGKDT